MLLSLTSVNVYLSTQWIHTLDGYEILCWNSLFLRIVKDHSIVSGLPCCFWEVQSHSESQPFSHNLFPSFSLKTFCVLCLSRITWHIMALCLWVGHFKIESWVLQWVQSWSSRLSLLGILIYYVLDNILHFLCSFFLELLFRTLWTTPLSFFSGMIFL